MIAFDSRVEGFIHQMTARIDRVEDGLEVLAEKLGIDHCPQLLKGLRIDARSSLPRLRRALFNAQNRMECAEDAILNQINALPAHQQDQHMLTQQLRDAAASVQLYFEDLKHSAEQQIKSNPNQNALDFLEKCAPYGRELNQIFYDLPSAGTSLHEWIDYSSEQLKSFRSVGRPTTPTETIIQRLQRDTKSLLLLIREVSGDRNLTLKEAMPTESKSPGRPALSVLGKLDRRLIAMVIKLQKMSEKPQTPELAERQSTLIQKIEDMRRKIQITEAKLPPTEGLMRDLEKLRARHRDLTVYEPVTNGREQDSFRLLLLQNELDQQRLVARILKADPNHRVSLNHRVNPSARLQRFNRILNSKHLTSKEKAEAREINRELQSYGGYRKRY